MSHFSTWLWARGATSYVSYSKSGLTLLRWSFTRCAPRGDTLPSFSGPLSCRALLLTPNVYTHLRALSRMSLPRITVSCLTNGTLVNLSHRFASNDGQLGFATDNTTTRRRSG